MFRRVNSIFRSKSHTCRMKSCVGFVGLGHMGSLMVSNLVKKGHSVAVFDLLPEAMSRVAGDAVVRCESAAGVAALSDRIITMLPNSEHVMQVYHSDSGILNEVSADTLLIDSSTIDPAVAKNVAHLAHQKSAVFMDAPVSGGVNAARDATLTFMVGGQSEHFGRARELLQCMGSSVVYCGDVSTGQAAKIANNMLLAISMIGAAEAMNLGIKLGLKPSLLAEIIGRSSGRCWSIDTYNPVPGVMPGVPSSNNYQGGFGTALMCKDLTLAQNAATSVGASTPLGAAALHIYRQMINDGLSQLDFSAVYKRLSS